VIDCQVCFPGAASGFNERGHLRPLRGSELPIEHEHEIVKHEVELSVRRHWVDRNVLDLGKRALHWRLERRLLEAFDG